MFPETDRMPPGLDPEAPDGKNDAAICFIICCIISWKWACISCCMAFVSKLGNVVAPGAAVDADGVIGIPADAAWASTSLCICLSTFAFKSP